MTARILLVEDDENDLAFALRAFRQTEMAEDVAAFHCGEDALAYLRGDGDGDGHARQAPPQVIFLDLKMAGLSGWDLLRELRADELLRDIPVVIVSSSSSERDVRESYRLGANSYIAKRYDAVPPGAYLVEAARYWLGLNRAPVLQSWEGWR